MTSIVRTSYEGRQPIRISFERFVVSWRAGKAGHGHLWMPDSILILMEWESRCRRAPRPDTHRGLGGSSFPDDLKWAMLLYLQSNRMIPYQGLIDI